MSLQVRDEAHLNKLLSEPTPYVIDALRRCTGDVILLGVAGKMGPSMAEMVIRASRQIDARRVIGVSRFSNAPERARLESIGVETIAGDLLDESFVKSLPDAPNVIYLAGLKFGSSGQPSLTWAMNTLLPSMVCRRYRSSRIVALSTGNVYPATPIAGGGSTEKDVPNPLGEYAMSCLGRERMFEYFSTSAGTRVALIRLNYACEMRYGVIVDIAKSIFTGQSVSLSASCFNIIWQRDANAMCVGALAHAASPALVLNVTGPEILSVRSVAERMAQLLDRPLTLSNSESSDAMLSNASRAFGLFGKPSISADELMVGIADWVRRGGASLNKPTHFEVRNGRF